MKISLNWLTDYVDVAALSAEALGEALTRIGICCDSIAATDTDVVFELEVTSNRPDCLGHIGIARELSAALHLPLKLPDLSRVATVPPAAGTLTSVQVLDPDLCPRYTARVIRNVKIGPSPRWMVERLAAVGLRSINNVVDVTNYVMLEYSQPLHSFDLAKLAGRRIVVRRGRKGESIVSIDGTRCALTGDMLAIADADKPVAIAGIMGGLETEISAATTDVLLEAAQFDLMTTRRTARALMLMSESSYRFERGIDPVGVDAASLRACQLILASAGGELADGVVDVWSQPFAAPEVVLRTDRCRAVLGIAVGDDTQAVLLADLGLSPRLADGKITCTIPSFRADLTREIDLIEEVARLHGLDKLPTRAGVTHNVTTTPPAQRMRRRLRQSLQAAGFDETVTYSFVDDAEGPLFGFVTGVAVDARIRRTNNVLRPTLLPSLLRVAKTNQDVGNEDVCLYELAAVFPRHPGAADDALPDEHVSLALVTQRDLAQLRGALDVVVESAASSAKLEIAPAAAAGFAAGASAEVRLNGQVVGVMGMVDQAALDYYGLEKPHAAATLRFDALLRAGDAPKVFQALPKFPPIRRDLSVVVDENVAWRQIADAVLAVPEPTREALDYVGTYRGKQVPAGKKSVTLTLTYRSPAETLRHEQVDGMVAAVLAELGKTLGATLRA
jgi:phenylalanyl-tRNA synthetase beta chain